MQFYLSIKLTLIIKIIKCLPLINLRIILAMKKTFKTITFGLVIFGFSACGGVNDDTCCTMPMLSEKSIVTNETNTTTEPVIKNLSPSNENNTTLFPPVAVITPDVQFLVPEKEVEFDCLKSYDQDEQGDEITGCTWVFKCFYNEKSTCNRTREVNSTEKVLITPSKGADYLEVTLTVIDDENQTNTTTMTYDIVE
jgi:hypothetical protein